MSGLFTGSGSSTQKNTSSTSYNTDSTSHGTVGTSYDPQFQSATSGLINQANINAANPYTSYGGMVQAPFNPTQEDAWWAIKNNPSLSAPYFGAASGYFNTAGQNNANTAAQPFLNQATGFLNRAESTPNGYTAAQPYAKMASESFTGDNVKRYMDPYLEHALGAQNRIANQNLTSSVLPAVNTQFIGSGGGARAGNGAYSNEMNRVLDNWQNNLFNSNALMTNAAYGTAATTFLGDQSRYAGLAGTMGNAANNALGAYGSLAANAFGGANTAASAASAANRDFTSLGGASMNAGQTAGQVGAANAASLLGVGQQLQDYQQKAADYGLQEFGRQQQYPFQTSEYLADILKSTRVPTTVTSDNQAQTSGTQNTIGYQTGTASSTPSVVGALTGLATAAAGFMKPGGHVPGYYSGGRVRFGGLDEARSMPPFMTNAGYWGPPRPIYGRDGAPAGYYARGGNVRRYAAGGLEPTEPESPDQDLINALLEQLRQGHTMVPPGGFAPPPPPALGFPAAMYDGSNDGGVGTGTGDGANSVSAGVAGTGPGAGAASGVGGDDGGTYARGGRAQGHFSAGGALAGGGIGALALIKALGGGQGIKELFGAAPENSFQTRMSPNYSSRSARGGFYNSPVWRGISGVRDFMGGLGSFFGGSSEPSPLGVGETAAAYNRMPSSYTIPGFAAGGAAPVIKAAKAANDKYVAGARAKAQRPRAGVTRQLALPSPGGFFS